MQSHTQKSNRDVHDSVSGLYITQRASANEDRVNVKQRRRSLLILLLL